MASEIVRWDQRGFQDMITHPRGQWVDYQEHIKALAEERERCKKTCKDLQDQFGMAQHRAILQECIEAIEALE